MKNLFLIALLGSLLVGCTSDKNKEQEQLLGKWELQTAERNGKITDTLKDLYFTFSENNTLETNIKNGEREVGTYQLKESLIAQRNTAFEIDYTIESISDSTLLLHTVLMNTDFRFLLKKAKE